MRWLISLRWICLMMDYPVSCDDSRCYCLPSVVAQIKRSKWVGNKWPKSDRARMAERAARLTPLPPPISITLLEALNSIIDEGEAYLLTHMTEHPQLVLLTGDVRMLLALHRSNEFFARDVREEIAGRVLIFPQIIGQLVRRLSVSEVENRWRLSAPANHSHRQKSLSVMFGSPPTREEDFWLGHELQLNSTLDTCGPSLLYPL